MRSKHVADIAAFDEKFPPLIKCDSLSCPARETQVSPVKIQKMVELIATKIVAPKRRPDLLDRPRLLDVLLAEPRRRLTFISAPAGFGKTTLLVDLAHRVDEVVCWYTVTESDTNLWVFARYLIGAIQQQFPHFGQRALKYVQEEPDDYAAFVASLINEMYSLDQPFSLFIDDFHLVAEVPLIKGFLETLIPLLPDHCHLVIASRTVPDFDPGLVTRLAAQRQIVGLGQRDLCFTAAEVQAFLREAYNHVVSLEEAQKLTTAAEGWISAIILTSQVGDPLAGIDRARDAGDRLYDYLATQVLEHLDPRIRTFLMESAILAEMAPAIVNTILGIDDAAERLEALERKNTFITRLESPTSDGKLAGQPGLWYRYHALFRDYLQARLHATAPERYQELQKRAAHALMNAGYHDLAIEHLLKAGSYEEAADAIEAETHAMITTARADRLSRWIDALPLTILQQRPRLLRYRASICNERDGDPNRALELCAMAEALLQQTHSKAELAWTLLEKATALRIQGRFDEVIACCEQAMMIVDNDAPNIVAEAQRAMGLAQAQLGNLKAGVAALRAALKFWQNTENVANQALLHNDLGILLMRTGSLTASQLHLQQALETWQMLNDASHAAMTLNNLALVFHYQGRYTEALEEYQHALQYAQEAVSRRYGAYILIGMGDVYRDLQQYSEAVAVYKQGLLDARKVADAFLGAYALSALGQTYYFMGQHQEGLTLLRRAYEDARERGVGYEIALHQLALGAIAHEQGFLDDAFQRLQYCVERFREGHLRELAVTYLHLAQAYYLAYRLREMQDCLREAELCLFRLGYDGFILPTMLRTAGAIRASREPSPYLLDLLEQAETRIGFSPETAQRPPQPLLKVYMFGHPRVFLGEAPLANEDWNRQRTQELFFYLLSRPHLTPHQIGADLWPDLPRLKVRNNVHVTFSYIRKALGNPAAISRQDGRYSIQLSHLWVDTYKFREAIELARNSPDVWGEIQHLERAISLYRGDFLENFSVTADDTWIREERERFRRMACQALERLIEHWTEQGDLQQVRRYTQMYRRISLDLVPVE